MYLTFILIEWLNFQGNILFILPKFAKLIGLLFNIERCLKICEYNRFESPLSHSLLIWSAELSLEVEFKERWLLNLATFRNLHPKYIWLWIHFSFVWKSASTFALKVHYLTLFQFGTLNCLQKLSYKDGCLGVLVDFASSFFPDLCFVKHLTVTWKSA